jgi:hypothetical protein
MFAGALLDQAGGGPGARAAVGEGVLGRCADQRGAGAPGGQGEGVAQGAAVAQLVTMLGRSGFATCSCSLPSSRR